MEEQGTKWRILRYLRACGEATAEEMQKEFDLGLTTLREHVYDLLERELIKLRKEQREGRGRRAHYYRLTEKAEATFPDAEDSLGTMFFRLLRRSLDDEKLDQLLQEVMIEYLQETNRQIESLLSEHGYQSGG